MKKTRFVLLAIAGAFIAAGPAMAAEDNLVQRVVNGCNSEW